MSQQDLKDLEREQLEKLFHMTSEDYEKLPPDEGRFSKPKTGGLQPYLIGAAAMLAMVGLFNILQPLDEHKGASSSPRLLNDKLTAPGPQPSKSDLAKPTLADVSTKIPKRKRFHEARWVVPGLSAAKSGLTGIVDARTMTASYYWTFVIKNDSSARQEALATIQLPENAVVSRATEWIDGVPQEAAFNTVAAVNRAYESVVAQKRDPLLVNYRGDGIVDLKAFPINPHGAQIKIRLGITAPMDINEDGVCSVLAPYMVSSNFDCSAAEDFHIEATSEMTTSQEDGETVGEAMRSVRSNGQNVLRGHLGQAQLEKLQINTPASSDGYEFAARATHSPKEYYIRFSLKKEAFRHRFIPHLERTNVRPNVPILKDEDAAFRLSNLWAAQEVGRLTKDGLQKSAERLATAFRLVTPVTSAVVLESNNDYETYGLHRNRYAVIGERTNLKAANAGAPSPAMLEGFSPLLQGATNGTIGPAGSDSILISGVNTAGTVMVAPNPLLDWISRVIANNWILAAIVIATLSVARFWRPRLFKP